MAKTNFTRAEEALSDALQKMSRSKLLEKADEAQGRQYQTDEELKRRQLIALALKRGLKRLFRHDRDIYKKIGVKKKELEKLLEQADQLDQSSWQSVEQAKEKVDQFIKLLPEETATDDQLVESERKKHINKRFNVSDKWLPLT